MKIGIMGGSYNPIHVGHAIIANYMIQQTGIDCLWLMVSPENPFKVGHEMACEEHRLRMTEMVSRHIEGVITSAFEYTLPRPSYTIDTLNALKEKFPDDEFYLIIGADNWVTFDRWRSHEEIIKNYHIIIYPRQGYDVVIPDNYKSRVSLVQAPLIEISSSYIRSQIAQNRSMVFYLPDEVNEYILKHKLYVNTSHGKNK